MILHKSVCGIQSLTAYFCAVCVAHDCADLVLCFWEDAGVVNDALEDADFVNAVPEEAVDRMAVLEDADDRMAVPEDAGVVNVVPESFATGDVCVESAVLESAVLDWVNFVSVGLSVCENSMPVDWRNVDLMSSSVRMIFGFAICENSMSVDWRSVDQMISVWMAAADLMMISGMMVSGMTVSGMRNVDLLS